MIHFLELELNNFRSWKHLFIGDFNKCGLCCIQGDNGSGKSSIRQAVEYLLTDKISDGIDLEELPRDKTEECFVRCILLKDNDKIEIIKYRNHKKFGNKTVLLVNGENNLTCSSRKDTQKNIEQLLDINQESLLASTVFSQFSKSFPESTESERKNVLYEFLSLNKYKDYYDAAKKTFEFLSQIIQEAESDLSYTKKKIVELCFDIRKNKIKMGSFDHDRREEAAKLIVESESLIEEDDTELKSELKQKEIMFSELNKDNKRKELQSIKSSIQNKKTLLERDIYLYRDKKDSISSSSCPVLNIKCDILESKIVEIGNKYQPLIDELNNKLELVNEELKKLEEEELKFEREKEVERELQFRIQELKNKIREIEFLNDKINSKKNTLKSNIEKLYKQENPYYTIVNDYMSSLKELIKQMKETSNNISSKREQLPYIEFWIEGFSRNGIPNLKVEGTLDKLESLTNSYLTSLGKKISVEIGGQRELKSGNIKEEISYKIHHHSKSITDYHSFSGGEKQRVKLADLLSFNDLLGKLDIMILDEILELSLDNSGKDSVVDLLNRKAKEFGSIFVITHSHNVTDKINNYLKVKKVNGVSELV